MGLLRFIDAVDLAGDALGVDAADPDWFDAVSDMD